MKADKEKILITNIDQEEGKRLASCINEAFPAMVVFMENNMNNAIKYISENDPFAILTGFLIPESERIQFCENVKRVKALNKSRLIFVIPHKSKPSLRKQAADCGADAFLYSPVYITDITVLLNTLLKIRKSNISQNEQTGFTDNILQERDTEREESSQANLQHFKDLKKAIVKRKKSEAALSESEMKFKSYIDHAPYAIFVVDKKGTYTEINRAATLLTGYTREEIIGKQIIDFIVPQDQHLAREHFKDVVKKNESTADLRFIRKDGQVRYSTVKAVKLSENRYIGFKSDITERKNYEQSLKESEEMYRLIAENTSDGIIVFDSNGEITYASPSYITLFGYSEEHRLDQDEEKIYELIHPEDRDALFEDIYRAIALKKKDLIYTYRFKKEDGNYIWREDHAKFKYDEKGSYLGSNVICRDITERKLAEEAYHKMEIARKTVQFKQNFLASMSHEIRTPLTGVLGMIDALKQTELSEKQEDFVNTIAVSGENLKEIINQVLDYSKIEAGKLTLKPGIFEFGAILQAAKELYRTNIAKKVDMKIHIDKNVPDYIVADKYRLSQIVNNLVSNAVKFTHEGSIDILASLDSPNDDSSGMVIKVTVKDTGIGIPVEMQRKLFIPFSQVDNHADIIMHEGTGLGLSISKELVHLMGGEIGVSSKTSQGSEFWFTFSTQKADCPKKDQSVCSEIKSLPRFNILFAEDKIVNQKVVKIMLNSLGHEVKIVDNGQQALEAFRPGVFDLILMDIQMPVMDGVTATRKLKEKYQNLPPIAGLSANAFEGDRERYMALGMDEYLTKPVKKEDFEELMGRLFQK